MFIIETLSLAAGLLPLVTPALPSGFGTCPTSTSDARGCAGEGGFTPQLFLAGDLSLGTDLLLVVDQAPGGAAAILGVGSQSISVPGPGDCTYTVLPNFFLPAIPLPGSGAGQGLGFVEVPMDIVLAGFNLKFQAGVTDPTAPEGFTLTNAIDVQFDPSCVAVSKLIEALVGTHAKAADLAYLELSKRGASAIEELIASAGTADPLATYSGFGYTDPRANWLASEAVSSRMVVLYAAEAILRGTLTPANSPMIIDADGTSSDPEGDAVLAFEAWLVSAAGMTLEQMQALPLPLSTSSLSWAGGAHWPLPESLLLTEVPGSETPYDVIPGWGANAAPRADSGTFILAPADPNGPAPYNCLAWAVGCQSDVWMQPTGGTSVGDIMEDNGYTPAEDFEGEATEKVKLAFNGPGEGDWTHAMKGTADGGSWSSKNGSGSMHGGVTDCDEFLENNYPDTTRTEVWCK